MRHRTCSQCSSCGHHDYVFGKGGAESKAAELGVPFLGGIPLRTDVRTWSDEGTPAVVADPHGLAAKAFRAVAEGVAEALRL